jgi:biotin/methionine sulfoxide reductase
MGQKYTAAHWGSYLLDGQDAGLSLSPLPTDPNPSRIGKGWVSAMQNPGTRIARPSIREGWLKRRDRERSGDAAFVEVPWDEALDLLAGELRRVIDTHGNGSIYGGSYGWASAGRFHHAQSHLRRFLNGIGGYVSARDTYSHAAAEVLYPFVVGMSLNSLQDQTTSWSSVAEHCELFVSFGGISPRTAQVASSGTTAHEVETWMARAQANGMECVNVSPLATDLPGAEWVALRPGTDTALILALAHEIYRIGRADRAFLARYTHGAEVFEAYVMGATDGVPKTAAWAAAICDVPEATIVGLAARMAESPHDDCSDMVDAARRSWGAADVGSAGSGGDAGPDRPAGDGLWLWLWLYHAGGPPRPADPVAVAAAGGEPGERLYPCGPGDGYAGGAGCALYLCLRGPGLSGCPSWSGGQAAIRFTIIRI